MTISGYFMNLNGFLSFRLDENQENMLLGIQLIFTIAAVVSFAFFLFKAGQFAKILDLKLRSATYFKLARLRLLLIGLSLFIGVVSLYAVRSEIAIYLIAVSAVLLLVSKPVEAKIDAVLSWFSQ